MSLVPKHHNAFVLLDNISADKATLLNHLVKHQRYCAAELDAIDADLAQGWAQSLHAFVYIPYEFGDSLLFDQTENQAAEVAQLHLFWFKVKEELDAAAVTAFLSSLGGKEAGVAEASLALSEEDYCERIDAVHEAIRRGEVYQINFTTQLDFKVYGAPNQLYRRLREQQQVPYATLAYLPLTDPWLLSLSPELFLTIEPDGRVSTKPMKGTAPVVEGDDVAEAIEALRQDPKNRAENVMIVDLLRNDLGRVAATGSVHVPALFEVERFGPVLQMTSTVEAQMPPSLTFSQLLKASFPCGSITGAPKHMSMQLIKRLEQRERGIYTGSIGLIEPNGEPNGLTFKGQLNVMIRSFHLQDKGEYFHGAMGVGSGIVLDSEAEAEYQECFWKARFILNLEPEFAIFETMRWVAGKCELLALHQERMLQSAMALRYPLTGTELKQAWQKLLGQLPTSGSYRLKVQLETTVTGMMTSDEHTKVVMINDKCRLVASLFALEELEGEQSLLLSDVGVYRPSYLSRHKITQRACYDRALAKALEMGAFDTVMLDENGYVLEGARTNIFLKINDCWYTPSLELPLLNGVMRQAVLADPERYLGGQTVVETKLRREDVLRAEEVRLTNALRGIMVVKLVVD